MAQNVSQSPLSSAVLATAGEAADLPAPTGARAGAGRFGAPADRPVDGDAFKIKSFEALSLLKYGLFATVLFDLDVAACATN
jgi:hypothetical protein